MQVLIKIAGKHNRDKIGTRKSNNSYESFNTKYTQ